MKLMDRWKAVYAQKTDKRVLADAILAADIFLGLSAPNVPAEMVKQMGAAARDGAGQPLSGNHADEARKARPDAMICTGGGPTSPIRSTMSLFSITFRGALSMVRPRSTRK